MIKTLKEVKERFDRIKDHKPKATKKLNELGEILASAYKFNADIADEMWQYLVALNVSDNPANAKFYIAQVFNKLTNLLEPEEATELLALTPERVQLLVLYGYDGNTMWHCLDTLIKGFLKLGSVENCIATIEFYFEKFERLHPGYGFSFSTVSNSIRYADELYQAEPQYKDVVIDFMQQLLEINDDRINAYVRISMVTLCYEDCDNAEELISLAFEYKFAAEFIELLWMNHEKMSSEEFAGRWISYLKELDEEHPRIPSPDFQKEREQLRNTYHLDGTQYNGSKMQFFVSLMKDNDEILPYYFNSVSDLGDYIVYSWIVDGDWDRFTRYVAQILINTHEDRYEYSQIKRLLDCYLDAYFYDEYRDSTDDFGRSHKIVTDKNLSEIEVALSSISAITVGAPLHDEFHETVKEFMLKASGNLDALNNVGFDEHIDERSPEQRLKDYIHSFLQSGEVIHDNISGEYRRICDAICESVDSQLERDYTYALDDEIAKFYFMHNPYEIDRRTELLSACIKKDNVDRAIALIDMMVSTKDNDGYNDLNGWGRQNMLTIKYLIREFDYSKKNSFGVESITDEMRQVVKQLIDRVWSSLPPKSQEELSEEIYRVDPAKDDFEDYIEKLLKDVDVYCTFPKPRGKGKAPELNRMSAKIYDSFDRLSLNGRLDIVEKIMLKFAAVREVLRPVTYDIWISAMIRGLRKDDVVKIYKNKPEIFEVWLESKNLRNFEIYQVAQAIGNFCTKDEFMSFKNMVFSKKGFIEGFDSAFNATSENTETILLFDGHTVKIELDYLEVSGFNPISNIALHFLIAKKTSKLRSVRVLSCRINDIETNDIGFYTTFDDGGPSIGCNIYDENSEKTLTVYYDFFRINKIQQVSKIELMLVMMDDAGKMLETSSPIVLEYDIYSGDYIGAG